MCRRPLPLLLALTALLVLLPAACHGLSCFSCEDPRPSSNSDHPLLKAAGAGTPPRCSEFDAGDDQFKIENCQRGLDRTCAKISWEGGEMRGCFDDTLSVGCEEEDDVTYCVCTDDYCNSAGLTAPALLLLLPAALLAAIYTA